MPILYKLPCFSKIFYSPLHISRCFKITLRKLQETQNCIDAFYTPSYINCIKAINTELKGGFELISLNYKDSRPIYQQIKGSFQQLILSGAITAETKLPSVRELASQLAINPNTIQRAYRELEDEGLIVSVPGKGSFASDPAAFRDRCISQIYRDLDAAVTRLTGLGVSVREITAHINSI